MSKCCCIIRKGNKIYLKILFAKLNVSFLLFFAKKPLKRWVTTRKVQKIFAEKTSLKLHLGCGTVYKEGWVNIDNNSDNNITKLDLNWDLRYPMPFPKNSVDFIFHEHMLEHLTSDEGQTFLKDCKRVLKKGGVMRIAMPDLRACIDTYLDDDWKEHNKAFLKKFGMDHIKTKAEMLNINFRNWGHKWLYDWEELERRLKDVGFAKIEQKKLRQSNYPELKNLETRNESILIAEVIK